MKKLVPVLVLITFIFSSILVLLTFETPASAAVTIEGGDNTTDGTISTTMDVTGTVPGSDMFMVASFAYRVGGGAGPGQAISDIVFNSSDSLTFGCREYDGEYAVELWYLANPTSGAYTITATWPSASDSRVGGTVFYSGVDSTSPVTSVDCSTSGGSWDTDPTLNLSSQSGDQVFGVMSMYSGGNTVSPDGDYTTEEWNHTIDNVVSSAVNADGATTVNLSWVADQSWPWAVAGISLAPTGGGSGGGSGTGILTQKAGTIFNYDYNRAYVENLTVSGTSPAILVFVSYKYYDGNTSTYNDINNVYFGGGGSTTYYSFNYTNTIDVGIDTFQTGVYTIFNPPTVTDDITIEFSENIPANNGAQVYAVVLDDVDSVYENNQDANFSSSINISHFGLDSSTRVFSALIVGDSAPAISNNAYSGTYSPLYNDATADYAIEYGYGSSSTNLDVDLSYNGTYQNAYSSIVVGFNNPIVGGDSTDPGFSFASPSGATTVIGTGSSVNFSGFAYDLEDAVKDLSYTINGGSANSILSGNSSYDSVENISGTDYFANNFNVDIYDTDLSAGDNTIVFTAVDQADNSATASYTISLDTGAPSISVTSGLTEGETITGTNDISIVVRASDTYSSIAEVSYSVDSNPSFTIIDLGGDTNVDSKIADLPLDVSDLTNGSHTIEFYAEDSLGNNTTSTALNFDIVYTETYPTCSFESFTNPTTDTTPTVNGTCTDVAGVDYVYHRLYDTDFGDLVDFPNQGDASNVTLTSGSWGDTTVSFSITTAALDDGTYTIDLKAYNGLAGVTPDNDRAIVRIDVEAVDNKAPTVYLNDVLPDPSTDTTPYISGTCSDREPFEVNSTINSMDYRIDAGSWVPITPQDGTFDSDVEIYSLELPALSVGATYTVEVRCDDSAGNSTDTASTNASDTFEIIAPSLDAPEVLEVTEDFTSQLRNAVNATNAVWGNGIVRLRENITASRTLIDGTNFKPKYDTNNLQSTFSVTKGTGNLIWYVKEGTFHSYNTQTAATNSYTASNYGINQSLFSIQQVSYGGNNIVFVGAEDGLLIYNVNTDTGLVFNRPTFNSATNKINLIQIDQRSGRLGAYLVLGDVDGTFNSNVVYIDTAGTPTTGSDDTVTWYQSTSGIPMDAIVSVMLDSNASNNSVYFGAYDDGIIRIHDNNTPTNTADDAREILTGYKGVFGITKDPDTNSVFFVDNFGVADGLYAIIDTDNTPSDFSDDDVYHYADDSKLNNKDVIGVEFIRGRQYVGDQLVVRNSDGTIIYYNTNGSYSDLLDDTIISLDISGGQYPLSTAGLVVGDYDSSYYNTWYASLDRSGLYRIDVTRGWDNTNQAIAFSPPPSTKTVIDNVELLGLTVIDRIDSNGLTAPESQAAVNAYISLDDGFTWEAIAVGELKQVDTDDYRVRFRLDLSQNPGTSPVVDNFSLSYAAYASETQQEAVGLTVSASPSTRNEGQNFNLTVEAVDGLGYPDPNFSGDITLELLSSPGLTAASGLTTTTVTLTNGVGQITNAIADAGTYVIRGTDVDTGTLTANSNVLTILDSTVVPPDPIPSLSFSADKYTIVKGDSAKLSWSSEYLDSLTIDQNVGTVDASGSAFVSPTVTTTYKITGTGSYGNLESSLTITVVSAASSSTDSSDVDTTTDNTEDEAESTVDLQTPFNEIEVRAGETVLIEWNTVGDADSVYVDYLGKHSSIDGSFSFVGSKDVTITLQAYKDGEIVDEEVIVVKVITDGGFINSNSGDRSASSFLIYSPLVVVGITFGALVGALSIYLATTGLGAFSGTIYALAILLPAKRKHFGKVFDRSNSEGISLAHVELFSKKNDSVEQEMLTDFEGKYGFFANHTGEYSVKVKAEGFKSESVDTKRNSHGEVIPDVPMTSTNKEISKFRSFWVETYPKFRKTLVSISFALFIFGFFYTIYALTITFSMLNLFVLFIYLVLMVVNGISFVRTRNSD